MHRRFDHTEFEENWRKKWMQDGLYDVGGRDEEHPKEYVLAEWPYPSGNLHIGHWYAFALPDIYVRYRRMNGVQVLFPMGFDAFGLPAENAAIKRDVSPRTWTENNIAFMRAQLDRMGNAFSWDKTCNSTDPEYYRWTQWMFTQFFEAGLAYRGEAIVNWDPVDNTVIANEQVLPDGTSERSGAIIEKKKMPQWMLRITDFADELIDDLDSVDWPLPVKEAQRNWIGRSAGAEIDFALSSGESVTVFTTRPDTLFGVTYLVLAPEHELVGKIQAHIENWSEVEAYVASAARLDDQERLNDRKEKTGVQLSGITATNPANGENIPVYIADYVLSGYGTGAIMAVPAHDERDFAFASKFGLEIRQVIESSDPLPYSGSGPLVNSAEFSGYPAEEMNEMIVKTVGGRMTKTYRLRDWSIGRQRYWGVPIPIVYDPDGNAHAIPAEHLPWTLPTDVDFKPTGEPPLAKSKELRERTEKIFGPGWTPEVETMDTFVDSSWYFLRYIDNTNGEKFSSATAQRDWMQVDTYFGGVEHTTMHLLYARFWQKALHRLGLVVHREPVKKRINRGLILGPDGNKMSKSKGNVIDPDEQVKQVGSDTVKMYLAFMGPYQGSNYPWDNGGVAGVHRFLERVNGLDEHLTLAAPDTERQLHKTITKVRRDIEEYKFNTAISAMMVFINVAEKSGITRADYEAFLRLLAPFAPHLTEELWHRIGHSTSIHSENYPVANEALSKDVTVTIGVQINGKLRGQITVDPEANEATAVHAAKASDAIATKLAEGTITKIIYVPGRILNFIMKP